MVHTNITLFHVHFPVNSPFIWHIIHQTEAELKDECLYKNVLHSVRANFSSYSLNGCIYDKIWKIGMH